MKPWNRDTGMRNPESRQTLLRRERNRGRRKSSAIPLWSIAVALFLVLIANDLHAQTPAVQSKWFHFGKDSLRIEFSTMGGSVPRPAVLVLSDRFGLHSNVRSVLKVLARLGFAAYNVPLRSTPLVPIDGMPGVDLDSTDIDLIVELTADISMQPGCSGKIALVGFDVGAALALEAANRMPFYKACVLFYPWGGMNTVRRILNVQSPVLLNLAQYDAAISLGDVNALKDDFVENGKHVRIRYFKEAKPFFFNPEHEYYHKKNMEAAWKFLVDFLRSYLK